jgi:RimJ/RimL family protein N-acetyltransferase
LAGLDPIETPRLILRLVEPRDAPTMTRLIIPEISLRLASWPAPFTAELADRKIAFCRDAAARHLLIPRVITRRGADEMIGWVSIGRETASSRRGVLSYWLGAGFHRQGILREAGIAAMAGAQVHFGVTSFEASCHHDNIASAATLRSLGFRAFRSGTVWAVARKAEEPCMYYETGPADAPEPPP